MAKYRIKFLTDEYEHWDLISLTDNPGWVTCYRLDAVGARIDTPVTYYPIKHVLNILKYG